ncbi:hypothetical protein [Pelagibius sp. Alg239-R121]|nr:hypothetical protein [Pelagibius sp. Alg239-R121]
MTRVSSLNRDIPIKTWIALWSCFGLTVGSAVAMASAVSCVLSAMNMAA